jgi:Ca2+-binding RTX toxin-like protein
MAVYKGDANNNTFNGTPDADQIYGYGGDDKLSGGAGDDLIDGGLGNDTISGGAGNDTIYADGADKIDGGDDNDQVVFVSGATVGGGTFAGGAGDDTLNFGANHATGGIFNATSGTATFTGFEYIADHSRLTGTTGNDVINLSGITSLKADAVDFQISGGAGDDTITGGVESDIITGGAGADTFIFKSALGHGIDTITDFANSSSAVHDQIQLSHSIFGALPTGALSALAFKDIGVAGATVDANDRIIYNHTTGALYYDADGSGTGAAVQFATLSSHPIVSAADFQVIG